MEQIPKEKFAFVQNREAEADSIARPHVGYWKDCWRRFKENKVAVGALILLGVLVLMCIFAPILSPYEYETMDKSARLVSPSKTHWFGTDKLGRDVFTRVWIGGRVSMVIGQIGRASCRERV